MRVSDQSAGLSYAVFNVVLGLAFHTRNDSLSKCVWKDEDES